MEITDWKKCVLSSFLYLSQSTFRFISHCLIEFTHTHTGCTHTHTSLPTAIAQPVSHLPSSGIVALSISIRCTVDSWGAIDFHQRWHLLCALPSYCLNHLTGPSHLNWIRCQTLGRWGDPLLLLPHENDSTDITATIATSATRSHSDVCSSPPPLSFQSVLPKNWHCSLHSFFQISEYNKALLISWCFFLELFTLLLEMDLLNAGGKVYGYFLFLGCP